MRLVDLVNPAYMWKRRRRVRPTLARTVWPVRSALAAVGVGLTSSDRRLAGLRDLHKGERAFIIGTGPSLRVSDLDRLRGELTFGVNQIVAAFGETDWRPTYYCAVDQLVLENDPGLAGELASEKACRGLFPLELCPYMRDAADVVYFRERPADWGSGGVAFSTDALDHVVGGATVVYTALQLAFYMGVREAILIGVDQEWVVSGDAVEHRDLPGVLERDGTRNHFHPDADRAGTLWCKPDIERQRRAFEAAKSAYERAGGRVLNATRGGSLGVFERASLDGLLCAAEVHVAPHARVGERAAGSHAAGSHAVG